jgi:hypothetical protein
MKAFGSRARSLIEGHIYSKMEIIMKAILWMKRNKAEGFINGEKESSLKIALKVNILITKDTVLVSMSGLMAANMKASSKMAFSLIMDPSIEEMGSKNMKENGIKAVTREGEFNILIMEIDTKENSRRISLMAEEYFINMKKIQV